MILEILFDIHFFHSFFFLKVGPLAKERDIFIYIPKVQNAMSVPQGDLQPLLQVLVLSQSTGDRSTLVPSTTVYHI